MCRTNACTQDPPTVGRYHMSVHGLSTVSISDMLARGLAGRVRNIELGHVDGRCSFESIMVKYRLPDPALECLARSCTARGVPCTLEGHGSNLVLVARSFAVVGRLVGCVTPCLCIDTLQTQHPGHAFEYDEVLPLDG